MTRVEPSADVVTSLARSVGAFVRSAPAGELPASLRRYRSFRPKSLARYRANLAGALEDEATRRKVSRWLDDDRPGIDRRDAEIAKLACERAPGWEQEAAKLARAAPLQPKPPPERTGDIRARYERERERSKQARADVRKARDELRTLVKAERAKLTETTRMLRAAESDAAEARRAAAAAQRESARAQASLDREQRKARRAVERAQAERDRARGDLRAARRDVEKLTAMLARADRPARPTPEQKPAPRPARPRKRRPLSAPKGRLEDDPATLDAWLDAPRVRLLVDGYNVTKSSSGFGGLALEDQRRWLVQGVGKLARRKEARAVVVFDGSHSAPPGRSRRGWGPAHVEYSRPNETADDHLVALVESLPPDPIVVVTGDRELQERVRALGATIATSSQLLSLVR
jgi:predicted RNA-binding protein with PIN domain